MKTVKVVELFAGVGGFRIGLDAVKTNGVNFSTIWANQWEPATKRQHAAEVYIERFGNENFSNVDIEKIIAEDFDSIPDHDLLCGGFPCQDYSVAKTAKYAKGLVGKKGVLFWSIYNILKKKGDKAPKIIFLENVDRLLKSPTKQRGKDFAVMLAALSDLGYIVEWKVVNAADYGFPQRRRRIYIIGYRKNKSSNKSKKVTMLNWLEEESIMTAAFPSKYKGRINEFNIEGSLSDITESFSKEKPALSPFRNCGFMNNRKVWTSDYVPIYNGKRTRLGDMLEEEVSDEFYINEKQIKDWEYFKGAKKEQRTTSTGFNYTYTEGSMNFPDSLNAPSRTIITSEGGTTPSRFKHVIKTKDGRFRRLTPLELERLNMFPDYHTKVGDISDTKRAFFMGNALVVGVITKIGESIAKKISD